MISRRAHEQSIPSQLKSEEVESFTVLLRGEQSSQKRVRESTCVKMPLDWTATTASQKESMTEASTSTPPSRSAKLHART
jgi:hypothetical protein